MNGRVVNESESKVNECERHLVVNRSVQACRRKLNDFTDAFKLIPVQNFSSKSEYSSPFCVKLHEIWVNVEVIESVCPTYGSLK